MNGKLIKIGTEILWRGTWGRDEARLVSITEISLCENEGDKYGIPMQEVWVKDKDRCCFTLSNNHWAYGDQLDVIEEKLSSNPY